jgi:hypothetical protein
MPPCDPSRVDRKRRKCLLHTLRPLRTSILPATYLPFPSYTSSVKNLLANSSDAFLISKARTVDVSLTSTNYFVVGVGN